MKKICVYFIIICFMFIPIFSYPMEDIVSGAKDVVSDITDVVVDTYESFTNSDPQKELDKTILNIKNKIDKYKDKLNKTSKEKQENVKKEIEKKLNEEDKKGYIYFQN